MSGIIVRDDHSEVLRNFIAETLLQESIQRRLEFGLQKLDETHDLLNRESRELTPAEFTYLGWLILLNAKLRHRCQSPDEDKLITEYYTDLELEFRPLLDRFPVEEAESEVHVLVTKPENAQLLKGIYDAIN